MAFALASGMSFALGRLGKASWYAATICPVGHGGPVGGRADKAEGRYSSLFWVPGSGFRPA